MYSKTADCPPYSSGCLVQKQQKHNAAMLTKTVFFLLLSRSLPDTPFCQLPGFWICVKLAAFGKDAPFPVFLVMAGVFHFLRYSKS